jgi:hypothetical protein
MLWSYILCTTTIYKWLFWGGELLDKPQINVKAASDRAWRGALLVAALLIGALFAALAALPASRGLAAELTEEEQKVVLDLFYVADAGVHQCCEGQSSGCSRYENATAGLSEWCAKGSTHACEFVQLLHASFLICQM